MEGNAYWHFVPDEIKKPESALCGDINPHRLERQSCSGWHNTLTLLYEVSRKYHFTFSFDSALCKWGWIFHRDIQWHPAHSGIIFDPQAIIARSAFCAQNLNFAAASVPQIWRGAKSSKWWPSVPDPWSFEPKIKRLRQTVGDYYCASFESFLSSVFASSRLHPTHAHTPSHTYHAHTSWTSDRYIRAVIPRLRRE